MSRRDYVCTVLDELGGDLGLQNLTLNDNDRVSVRHDTVPITFAYSEEPVELLWLYADLGQLIPEGYEAPAFLLQLGFVFWASNRMTVGLDDKGEVALGYTVIPVSTLTFQTLKEVFNQLVDTAKPVRERLEMGNYNLDIVIPEGAMEAAANQTNGAGPGSDPKQHFRRV